MCKKCREVPMAKKVIKQSCKGESQEVVFGRTTPKSLKKVAGLSALQPSAEYLLEKLSSTAGFRCFNLLLLLLDL